MFFIRLVELPGIGNFQLSTAARALLCEPGPGDKAWACVAVCVLELPMLPLPSVSTGNCASHLRSWNSGALLYHQKNKRALTCYFPPHPRTHKEPHENGEEQRYAKGDERYRPDGEDQAEHWGQKRQQWSQWLLSERSSLTATYFLFP